MHLIYLIHEFHNLSWITEINELFHDILIYWDAPVQDDQWFDLIYVTYTIIVSLQNKPMETHWLEFHNRLRSYMWPQAKI